MYSELDRTTTNMSLRFSSLTRITVMSHLVSLLGALTLVVVMMIQPSTQHLGRERCWPTKEICSNASAFGTHFTKQLCHLRCMCRGHLSGYCYQSTDCRDPRLPWKCECMGQSNFNKWPICAEPKSWILLSVCIIPSSTLRWKSVVSTSIHNASCRYVMLYWCWCDVLRRCMQEWSMKKRCWVEATVTFFDVKMMRSIDVDKTVFNAVCLLGWHYINP